MLKLWHDAAGSDTGIKLDHTSKLMNKLDLLDLIYNPTCTSKTFLIWDLLLDSSNEDIQTPNAKFLKISKRFDAPQRIVELF